ncbi:MAG TPA: twin transmembrane helix small protein [Roseiarcus sp.]|nr:twin transmembrane helix small protein [Roseiarcus sp.]
MPSIPNAAVTVAILAVAVVLVLGLVNMLREGASNTSQKLMRWRVGLQFLAIVIIVVVLLTRTH